MFKIMLLVNEYSVTVSFVPRTSHITSFLLYLVLVLVDNLSCN